MSATIYSPEETTRILDIVASITLSNNGYSRFQANETTVNAVRAAGFIVFRSTDLHGNPCWFGSTRAAQESLRTAPYGVSTYKDPTHRQDEPDYEGMILARQERSGFYD
jgi:hypothetical protein